MFVTDDQLKGYGKMPNGFFLNGIFTSSPKNDLTLIYHNTGIMFKTPNWRSNNRVSQN